MQSNEKSSEGYGIEVSDFDLIESQMNQISNRFEILAKKCRKTPHECIEFFKSKAIHLVISDFTTEYLIGFACFQIELVRESYKTKNIAETINVIFHLGQTLGIAQTLNQKGKNKEELLKEFKSDTARNAALARLAKDLKQLALKNIELEYDKQKSQFKRRGYTMQFIRDMHVKYPIITDQKTIGNLVAKLNKANEHIPRKLA